MGELLRHSRYRDCTRRKIVAGITSSCSAPAMDRRLKERMAIERACANALQRQQLDVHYQPIIDIQMNPCRTSSPVTD